MSGEVEPMLYEKVVAAQVETELNRQWEGYLEDIRKGFVKAWPHCKVDLAVTGTPPCPLCAIYDHRRRLLSQPYYEDEKIIIVNCMTCGIPMIVFKKHAPEPSREEISHAHAAAVKLFKVKGYRPPRTIKDHYHVHIER